MRSWVKEGERPGQKDWASANGGCTHHCTYNSRKRGAGPLLVMSVRNQEKPNSGPGLALLETASPLRLMGPKWSALGCPHHAFIGKAALPDIGLQCSQPHHGSEHGQRPPTTSPKGGFKVSHWGPWCPGRLPAHEWCIPASRSQRPLTAPTNFPSKAELLACLPPKRLRLKPAKAWGSLFMSLSLSLAAYGLGTRLFGTLSLVFYLLLGWPLYPLFGITGGKDYGTPTSHCWSAAPFRNGRRPLFPGACKPLIRHLNRALVAMLLAPSPGCQSVFASAGAVPV
jgi:hypothetical protein